MSREAQGKFATAANPLGFHVLAWTVPLEATPQPLPAKAPRQYPDVWRWLVDLTL
jgi:hypothetical protein